MRWQAIFATTIMSMTNVAALSLRVITSNIRYAAAASTYEKPWSVRGPLLIEKIKSTAAAAATGNITSIPVLGMQEVLHAQLLDIRAGLGAQWAHLGTGRDDGAEKGEYCPILYQPAKVRLVYSTQKWLSKTPDVPSFWPGAGSRRYVLVAVFEEMGTGTRFVAANTHLDNASREARTEGARIALRVIADVQGVYGPDLPVVLSGDFNSEPGTGDAYGVVVQDGYLGDGYVLVDEGGRFGPYETYTGFNPGEVDGVKQRIDFIWAGPRDGDGDGNVWDVERYEVLSNVVDGVYFSDHRPVVVDVALH
ncbi:endonuclease/exonuclease/phosphatase [Xylaria bambusicola]|uniref:endonuclease/exonuclease/phosphatase n=1 Tax=Xylaria bambusicola TaxID=326684 RepID=UPI0020081BF8|nr:endonuclease/exonuclease/phosphatase [Xylaria bambusicola]KAI0506246.1 endonuclease/exonuclease/phosphatase [Xylaria bambusicola]